MSATSKSPHSPYKTYFVAYLDIIGFKDMIKKPKSASTIVGILKEVHKIVSWVGPPTSTDQISMSHFSDTIVVTVPYDNDTRRKRSPLFAIAIISFTQATLTKHNCFLRGAIAIGDHYQDKKTRAIFGPAYLIACKLEKTAIWPRVILDRSALDLQKTYASSLSGCDDGLAFIDYLKEAFELANGTSKVISTTTPFTYDPVQIIRNHRHAILRARRGVKDVKILQKYYYLASYHNKVVKTLIAKYPAHKTALKLLKIRLRRTFPALYHNPSP